jgi:hypothetical protein
MVSSEIKEVDNKEVVDEIVAFKLNPDLPNGYRTECLKEIFKLWVIKSTIKKFTDSCFCTCSWRIQGSEPGVIL